MNRTAFSFVALAVMVVGLVFGQASLTAQKFDLTGEWLFDVQTEQGGGSPTFIFKQTGDKLAGKYKGQFGEADLAGTVTGKTFKFAFKADAQGQEVNISYEGEIESNTSVKGKLDIAGLATGTFTGKKK